MRIRSNHKRSDKQIVALFNQVFWQAYNTQLIGGGEEPEYIPANKYVNYHRIIYREDYIASALHEVAHWCIAGRERRQQHDYGYWYIPDGRSEQQQAQFEWVESKSQALEWIFSNASKRQFIVSIDNLDNTQSACNNPSINFKRNIVEHAQRYCQGALNTRASIWSQALYCQYGDNSCSENNDELFNYLDITHYSIEALR